MSADGSHPGPRLRVSVVDDNGRPVRVPSLAAWLAGVAPARARGAVTLAIVSDRRVRTLNRLYRGIDRATDVLSFPSEPAWIHPPPPAARRPPFLGDIVIARGVAARQARQARHPELTEWRVLALHGLLHLLGYDHEADAGEMQRVERRLRRKGGLDLGLIERGGTA